MVNTTLNLRDPEDRSRIITVVPAGFTVHVIRALDDNWYLVEYNGTRGIIKGGYFTEDDP